MNGVDNGGDSATTSPPTPPSLSKKLHSSLSSVSCCFRRGKTPLPPSPPRLLRSASVRALPRRQSEIKQKISTIISRLSCRRRHSADFRYDALSYSMNFDDGVDDDDSSAGRFTFSSRLPASPSESPLVTSGNGNNSDSGSGESSEIIVSDR